jgi:hypothetical protein
MRIDAVRAAICNLPRKDREALRPWLLARFDERGYDREEPPTKTSDKDFTVGVEMLEHSVPGGVA